MILLWGLPGNRPLASVLRTLERRNCCVQFIDQRMFRETDIELQTGSTLQGKLRIGHHTIDLLQVMAVYARPHDIRRLPSLEHADPNGPEWRHARTVEDILMSWLDITPALVVNPFAAMASNSSKPYQASVIKNSGFRTPTTLITTDPEAALEFWGRFEAVIYKSISGVRSVISRVSTAHRERLQDVVWCPTQFQQYVPGIDYRVHVVGDEVFACRISSEADDYRYASRQGSSVLMKACTLPPEIAERCITCMKELHLVVAGVDLRLTPAGEWYCFEVNPSPGFTFFQDETNQPIDESIARLLSCGSVTSP